jgi:hypothetical protein
MYLKYLIIAKWFKLLILKYLLKIDKSPLDSQGEACYNHHSKTRHLNTETIQFPNIFVSGFQMVFDHLLSVPGFEWSASLECFYKENLNYIKLSKVVLPFQNRTGNRLVKDKKTI